MSKTKEEIASSVLTKLGRLPAGQVALEGQVKTVTDAYDGLYDELFNDSLVNWALTEDIPEFAVYPVTVMLLGMVADNFNVPNRWAQSRISARFALSQQITSPYVPQPTLTDDF